MQLDLSGHRALVTGSTAGIGLAVARGLAQAGAAVVVNGRGQQRTDAAVAQLRDDVDGADITGAAADLGTAEGCEALADAATAAGPVDVLVNNVGVFTPKPFFELTDEDWETTWSVNVLSGVRLARRLVPAMVERGYGRVVFISSESALQIPVEMVQYGTTKTAQLAVSRGLAESVPGSGVTVNSVLPGPTRSEGFLSMLDASRGDTPREQAEAEFVRSERPTSVLQRLTSPEEVANMVVYVCSPLASGTTGAALRVDGGVTRFVA